jgi:hypothetical protein
MRAKEGKREREEECREWSVKHRAPCAGSLCTFHLVNRRVCNSEKVRTRQALRLEPLGALVQSPIVAFLKY